MKTLFLVAITTLSAFGQATFDARKLQTVGRDFIKAQLKAPATALFSNESLCMPVAQVNHLKSLLPNLECTQVEAEKVTDGIGYRVSVDAQNSFGGLIRTEFRLHFSLVNGNWVPSLLTDYVDGKCQVVSRAAVAALNEKPGHLDMKRRNVIAAEYQKCVATPVPE